MKIEKLTSGNHQLDRVSFKDVGSQGSFDSIDYIKQQSLLAQYKFGGKQPQKLPSFNIFDAQSWIARFS